MGHGTVGYCFEGDPERGGKGYLIGIHRCQSFKVVQRKTREQTVNLETGKKEDLEGEPSEVQSWRSSDHRLQRYWVLRDSL